MKPFFISLYTLLLLSACTQQKASQQDDLKAEVIAVHDSIMPKMGHFVRESKNIDQHLAKMDSLKQIQPDLDTADLKQKMRSVQQELTAANDEMTNWMHEFEPDQGEMNDEEYNAYLEGELHRVKGMEQQFIRADSILAILKKQSL